MLIFWGIILFVVGILIQNYSVAVRRGVDETKPKNSTLVFLVIVLVCWVCLVLGGLVLLFLQAWWIPIVALVIGARFVKK